MNETLIQHAKRLIRSIQYATVATASAEGKPWNSPVFYLYDNDMNIYWLSDKENQHSQNVRANGDAFIVIYDSTVPVVPVEGCKGVYLQTKVIEINDLETARKALANKNINLGVAAEDCVGDAVRRIYKATPVCAWVNDAEVVDGAPRRDFRLEIPLSEIKNLLA
ncbi:MAG TPA: pyridoxamine 5'-phosphate oxidase family protein [Verrucomicrobiae bacterium]|nr:pyridoxamine 5'-phosphate oxidase family protein [Verrucomicrobiae bacterium]